MQGIVGMLDVMYANVLEAGELEASDKMRNLIRDLKGSIEIIQGGSPAPVVSYMLLTLLKIVHGEPLMRRTMLCKLTP